MGVTLGPDGGRPVWVLGELHIWKASGAETGGRYALMENVVAPGGEPPPHVHHNEDEAFYVLSGDLAFTVGDQEFRATTGSFVFGPRNQPHTFRVTGPDPARLLVIVSPPGFEGFSAELGRPAEALTPPPPAQPDMEKLALLTEKYGIEIVAPPV